MSLFKSEDRRSIAEDKVIAALYRGILGRAATPEEIDHHRKALAESNLAAVIGLRAFG